jgi:hypothetical protein
VLNVLARWSKTPYSIHTGAHLGHQSIPILVGLVGAGGSENGSINKRNRKAG